MTNQEGFWDFKKYLWLISELITNSLDGFKNFLLQRISEFFREIEFIYLFLRTVVC